MIVTKGHTIRFTSFVEFSVLIQVRLKFFNVKIYCTYSDADKSLARSGRKQATATADFDLMVF
jgi:hypothetical protein